MRILTFTSLFPNRRQPLHGIFVEQRVRHLAQRGHFLQVVAPVPYVPRWVPVDRWRMMAEIPEEERVGELEVRHPRYPLLPKVSMPLHGLLMYLGCVGAVERLHASHVFDCIDSHYVYPDGLAAVLLGKRLGLPVTVTGRGTDINLFPSFPFVRSQIRWTLRQAAGVIGVSEALREEMLRLGAPAQKTQAIGNGIDPARFGMAPRQEARRRLGIPENAKVVVSVAALVPPKGHPRLIQAVDQLRARWPQLQLWLIGEGPCRGELQAMIKTRGLQDFVHMAGAIPNETLKIWYNAADVSCLASSREGWANVLLESLACGTPVVATRVGGAAEVISSTDLGLLVEPNTESIAAGLDLALGKRWDRQALAQYAQARTWDRVAQEVESFVTLRVKIKSPVPAGALPAAPWFV